MVKGRAGFGGENEKSDLNWYLITISRTLKTV